MKLFKNLLRDTLEQETAFLTILLSFSTIKIVLITNRNRGKQMEKKVLVVTGASKGIGLQIVLAGL
ncbi:hypothetical protein, partial [Enterococcus cecorum]